MMKITDKFNVGDIVRYRGLDGRLINNSTTGKPFVGKVLGKTGDQIHVGWLDENRNVTNESYYDDQYINNFEFLQRPVRFKVNPL